MHTFSLIKQTQGEADRFEIIRNWAESDLCCHFKQRCELFCVPNEPLHLAEFGFKVLRHRNSVYWVFQSQSPCYITLEMVQWRNMAEKYSVQFSRSVMFDFLWPHESQHARSPCPSPTPRVHSNSHPSSQWCHTAISSSVVPFSSCPQFLPASESFPMSQLFAWGGQSTRVSALASFLPKNTQDWSPLEWTGWISLQSMGLSSVFSNTVLMFAVH